MKNKFIKVFIVCACLTLLCSFATPSVAVCGAEDLYNEDTQLLVNPDCGFYKAFSGSLMANSENSPISLQKMAENAGLYGLYHLRIGLEDFSKNAGAQDRDIDASAVKGLKSALDYLRTIKMSAIIRFSYNVSGEEDGDGNYLENEPSISWIVRHIKTLGEVISEYSDVILGVESGMVGPWGEQHSTAMGSHKQSNAGTYHKIVQTWLESTPNDMGVTVRRPLYFTYWANEQFSLDLSIDDLADFDCANYQNADRVGVYNDGYLGSSTDLGTFTDREVEVAFIGKQAQNTYYGGEVVADRETGSIGEYNSVGFLEKEGFVTHTSYLNIDWNYTYVISKWQSNLYKGEDLVYNGKTTEFTFVNNRLGYRHLITGVTAPNRCTAGDSLNITLEVQNKGFARMFKKPVATIIIKTPTATESVACELDLTLVNSCESMSFDLEVALPKTLRGESEIFLNLQTVYGRTIYLANDDALEFDEQLNAYKLCDLLVDKHPSVQDKFLVTFDANYGRVVSGKTSQTVSAGESAVAPVVERTGYRFVGWSCDFSNITQNTNVVAVWEKIENDPTTSSTESGESGQGGTQGSSESVGSCAANAQTNAIWLVFLAGIAIIKIIKKSAVN